MLGVKYAICPNFNFAHLNRAKLGVYQTFIEIICVIKIIYPGDIDDSAGFKSG